MANDRYDFEASRADLVRDIAVMKELATRMVLRRHFSGLSRVAPMECDVKGVQTLGVQAMPPRGGRDACKQGK